MVVSIVIIVGGMVFVAALYWLVVRILKDLVK